MTVTTKVPRKDCPIARLRGVSRALGAFISLAGGVVLSGWMLGNAYVTSVLPGMPAMVPWTAIAFLLAGGELARQLPASGRRFPSPAAVGVLLLGLLTLIEYATGWDLGFDRMLFREKLGGVVVGFPGRVSPQSAACFLLNGAALLLANAGIRYGHRPVQALTSLAGLIALHAVIGHTLEVRLLYGITAGPGMALHTALLFLMMSLGLLFRDPDRGFMTMITGDNAGAAMARRLLPATFFLPLLLAWLNASAQRAQLLGATSGAAAMVIATMLGFGLLIWRSVRALERLDQQRGETAEQFRTLADSIPQLVWMARPDGFIFWYNRRWYDYTGTTLAQMEGWGWRSVHDPAELPRVVETIQASFASGQPWDCTFPLRRHDGVFRWHLSRMLPVKDEQGRVLLWFGSNTDVTEQREASAQLEQSKEAAEAANRAKSEFLANMSHEIRTPMNGILGMTELTLATDLTPRQREYIDLVKSSADALLVVIDDILDFSKIEAGKLDLDPIPFAPRDMVNDTLKSMAHKAHAKGLELACRFDPGVPGSVIGDPGRLRQVLVNLVGNAVKFTDRGEVVVGVEPDPAGDGPWCLLFSVADSGIGIPASKRAAIFAPFEQADGSTTRKYGGTGLGLTISARLIELMHGRIWVEENPGGGSVFRFTARLDVATEALSATPEPSPILLDGLRVLIVDDNRTNRMILEEVLSQWGCRPLAVSSGAEALDVLGRAADRGEPYPLVLLDLMMPEMDGCELAGCIRTDPRHRATRMLMLTSGGLDESGRFRELGIGGWLDKPVRQTDLLNAMFDLVGLKEGPALPPSRPASIAAPQPRTGRRLRVLLAEDHPVNQKVASRMIEAQGHEVTVAGNGRLALAALATSGPFDLILMDVQMPEMGGFEATAAIRSAEGPGGRRMPIVALTALAMAGDRERCLVAGFDDYLTKPITAADLVDVLNRASAGGLARPPAAETPSVDRPAFDIQASLDGVGGDEQLLAEVLAMFLEETPRILAEARLAVMAGDAPALGRLGHTLAGAAGQVSAREIVASARRLETSSDAENLIDADDAIRDLGREFDRFRVAAGASRLAPGIVAPTR